MAELEAADTHHYSLNFFSYNLKRIRPSFCPTPLHFPTDSLLSSLWEQHGYFFVLIPHFRGSASIPPASQAGGFLYWTWDRNLPRNWTAMRNTDYFIDPDLNLQTVRMDHAEELFRLTDRNREHLRVWLPWLDITTTLQDTKNYIHSSQMQALSNRNFQACVMYKGEIAGQIGFHQIDWMHKYTGLGYWLGESFQGKGIMTRATRFMIHHAFTDLKLNRIEIRVASGNEASRKIPERLGFKLEGVLRKAEWLYDHYVDHLMYSVLAEEWEL